MSETMCHKSKLLLILTLTSVTSCFGQVILNGGFESGQLDPWFQGNNNSNAAEHPEDWNVTSSDAHSGMYAATDIGNIQLRQNFAPVSTSQIQEVSLWARQPFGPALFSVYYHYSDGVNQFNRLDTTTTGWEFFDLTSKLAPNKLLTGVSVYGYSNGSPGRTLVDDINVTLVPEPSVSILGSSFIASAILLRLRRKHNRGPNRGANLVRY